MKRIFAIASLAILLASCSSDEDVIYRHYGEEVGVSIGFCVESETTGTAERDVEYEGTKAIIDSNDPSCIKNLWVVQYNGTSDASLLMGTGVYLDSASLSISGTTVNADLKLISTASTCTVFFIANTSDKSMVFPNTLGEMKALRRQIAGQDNLFGYNGEGDRHIIFSGWATPSKIESGTNISLSLIRNIAKIRLHVINSSYNQTEKVTIKSVKLRSVPDVSFYFPTYGNPSIFPASGDFGTIDYPSVEWTTPAQGSATVSRDFDFYVPVDMRGTVSNTSASEKGKFNPGGAISAVLECTYRQDDTDVPVNYTFFLGANLTNDFNISSNKYYTYDLEIKNRGTSTGDSRIDDYGTVDYTLSKYERSNSYILNPPTVDGIWRTFKIPVDRVNTFWGLTSTSYEYNANYQLTPSSTWTASVIWADFDLDGSLFRFAGGGSTLSGIGTDPIVVQVKKGLSGNVLIGIKRTDGATVTPYLWSWHLWITDYSPDDVTKNSMKPVSGVYDYGVTGGNVHRVEGNMWTSGIYKNSFMMDRNLGALDTKYHDNNTPGTIYYQFGRKDPLYYPKSNTAVSRTDEAVIETTASPAQPVLYSIANPSTYIYNKNTGEGFWTKGNKYNPASYDPTILWQDPQARTTNHRKSLFDPCPTGWKLMERGALDAFTEASFVMSASGNGRVYKGSNFFPIAGRRSDVTGGMQSVGTYGFISYSQSVSLSNSNVPYFTKTNIQTGNTDRRAYGNTTRCVSE